MVCINLCACIACVNIWGGKPFTFSSSTPSSFLSWLNNSNTTTPQTVQGSRIRLFQIRLHHSTQFSKPLSAEAVEFDCSKSDYTIPHNSPNLCQPRQSNSTVPNQTTPFHRILQTAVSRGSRIRLFLIRLRHTTQFSKPLPAEAWGLCPYTRKGVSNNVQKLVCPKTWSFVQKVKL